MKERTDFQKLNFISYLSEMSDNQHRLTYLITGGAGSIARMFIRALFSQYPMCKIIALDNDDTDLYRLQQEYEHTEFHLIVELDDILNQRVLNQLIERHEPDLIIHTAAHKQVSLLEAFPERAYQINTLASILLFKLAQSSQIPVIFISTDKSVEPISVLGFTKWLAECAFISMQVKGCVLRLPNIWQTKGSFFSEFLDLYKVLGFIPLTHTDCERFIMAENELSNVLIQILEQLDLSTSTIVIPKNVSQIHIHQQLLEELESRKMSASMIKVVGLRPGEKIYEKMKWDSENGTELNLFSVFSKVPMQWNGVDFLDFINTNLGLVNLDSLKSASLTYLNKRLIVHE